MLPSIIITHKRQQFCSFSGSVYSRCSVELCKKVTPKYDVGWHNFRTTSLDWPNNELNGTQNVPWCGCRTRLFEPHSKWQYAISTQPQQSLESGGGKRLVHRRPSCVSKTPHYTAMIVVMTSKGRDLLYSSTMLDVKMKNKDIGWQRYRLAFIFLKMKNRDIGWHLVTWGVISLNIQYCDVL